jgi:adenylyltransferase/sulfurtransferase
MAGRLLRFDSAEMRFDEMEVRRDPECCLCGTHPTQTGLVDYASFCGLDASGEAGESSEARIAHVTPQQLRDRLEQGVPLQLVDVRTVNEYQLVRIDGALLAPADEIEEHLHALDRALPTVCYCKEGILSVQTAQYLAARGFRDVASLDGGIDAWTREIEDADVVY